MADNTQTYVVQLDAKNFDQNIQKILTELKQLQTQVESTNTSTQKVGKAVEQHGLSFSKLAGAVGLATGGYQILSEAVSKTIQTFKEGLDLFVKEESFTRRLSFALNDNALVTDRMIKLRDKLNKNPLFKKEQINEAVQFAVEMGRSESQTQKMIIAAEGLSRVTGTDLQTAMVQLNQTLEGQKGRLARYVGDVKHMTEAQLRNGEAIDAVAKKLGKYGEAAGATETAQAKLSKKWDDVKLKLATGIAPAITTILGLIGKWIDYWTKVGEAASRIGTKITTLLKPVIDFTGRIGEAFQKIYDFTDKYLKPVRIMIDILIAGFKSIFTGLGSIVELVDKLLGGENKIYKAGQQQAAYAKKIQDDYVAGDAKTRKKLIADQQTFYEASLKQQLDYAAKGDKIKYYAAKRSADMHKKLMEDLANLDVGKKVEPTDAEIKAAKELAQKKVEAERNFQNEILKLQTEAVKNRSELEKTEVETELKKNQERIDKELLQDKPNLDNLRKYYDDREKLINVKVATETSTIQKEISQQHKVLEQERKDDIDKEKKNLDDKIINRKEYNSRVGIINKTYDDLEVSQQEEAVVKVKNIVQEGENDIIGIKRTSQQQIEKISLNSLNRQKDGLDKFNKEVEKIQKGLEKSKSLDLIDASKTIKQLDQVKSKVDEVTAALQAMAKAQLAEGKLTQTQYDDFIKSLDESTKKFNDDVEQTTQTAKDKSDELVTQIEDAAIQIAQQISDGIFANMADQVQQQLQTTLDAIDTSTKAEYDHLADLNKKKIISDKQYNQRKAALDKQKADEEKKAKRDAAAKQREADVLQAIINGVLSVTAALTQAPPASYVMAALNAATAIVNVALITSKPLAEFKKGGKVPKKYDTGGQIVGPTHEQGGVPIEAEGGEFIVNKSVAQKPGVGYLLENINRGNINGNNAPQPAVIDNEALKNIVRQVVSIPVNVVETDITRVQKKVNVIETKSTW